MRKPLRALLLAGLSIILIAPATSARAEPSVPELTQQIEKSSAKLEKIVESYNKLNEQIKATRSAAAKIGAQLGPLEKQLEESRAEVNALAVQAYKTGGLSTAGALLSAGDSGSLLNRLGALDRLARERDRQIAVFDAAQRQYSAQKDELDKTLARQTAQAKELVAGKKKIEADLDKLYELRRVAYGSATSAGSSYNGPIPSISGSAGVAVTYAYNAIGKPYVWGAEGPGGLRLLRLDAGRLAGGGQVTAPQRRDAVGQSRADRPKRPATW